MMRKNGFSQLRKLLPVVAVCALALTVGCSDDDDTTTADRFSDTKALLDWALDR